MGAAVPAAFAAEPLWPPGFAAEWLSDWLADGAFASAAWAGYLRLPKFGLYRILEAVAAAP